MRSFYTGSVQVVPVQRVVHTGATVHQEERDSSISPLLLRRQLAAPLRERAFVRRRVLGPSRGVLCDTKVTEGPHHRQQARRRMRYGRSNRLRSLSSPVRGGGFSPSGQWASTALWMAPCRRRSGGCARRAAGPYPVAGPQEAGTPRALGSRRDDSVPSLDGAATPPRDCMWHSSAQGWARLCLLPC